MNLNFTTNDLKKAYAAKGYAYFAGGNYNLNIFGIRSAKRDQSCDKFDDLLGVSYVDAVGKEVLVLYAATTDPGLEHLVNPQFREAIKNGTAILKEGQYRAAYQLGWHGSGRWRHHALIQVRPVTCYRDANRDSILDTSGKESTGLYGINIHAASLLKVLDKIGAYSAGCQVIRHSAHMQDLAQLCRRQAIEGLGSSFTYTLFDEEDFA